MNQETLEQLIDLADGHQAADEYQAGHYEWKQGACAVGCTIRDAKLLGVIPESTRPDSHKSLESLGVPEMVWRHCDHIFEGLPEQDRAAWPPRFFRAIRPGADYTNLPSRLMSRFAARLAVDAIDPDVGRVATTLSVLWARRAGGDGPPKTEWEDASSQANAAYSQADAACWQFWAWCADVLCIEMAQ